MTDHNLDLDALRKIAENATPGPWVSGETTFGDPAGGPTHVCVRQEGSPWTEHLAVNEGSLHAELDAAHIATFDPPTVLALIDMVEGLREALASSEYMRDVQRKDRTAQALDRLRAENDRLRGEVERLEGRAPARGGDGK